MTPNATVTAHQRVGVSEFFRFPGKFREIFMSKISKLKIIEIPNPNTHNPLSHSARAYYTGHPWSPRSVHCKT